MNGYLEEADSSNVHKLPTHGTSPQSACAAHQHVRPSPLLPGDALARVTQDNALHQPQDQSNISSVPNGLDAASFVAGERAAYARAFAAVLPAQQALGQLFAAVETLHSRLEEDAQQVKKLVVDQVRTSTALEGVAGRVATVEDVVSRPSPLSPEVTDALQSLRDLLANLALTQYQNGNTSFVIHQLRWLSSTAAAWAGTVFSGADVAAVFLSRRILIGDMRRLTADQNNTIRERISTALGASLFVGLVEAAYQVHERTMLSLPKPLRRINAPMRTGLRAARAVVWSAAFVLAATETRCACLALAGRIGGGTGAGVNGGNAAEPRTPGATPPPATARHVGPRRSPPPPRELMKDNVLFTPKSSAAGARNSADEEQED